MYGDDNHNHFESHLATFTRAFSNTENRQNAAWRGWIEVLNTQYTPQFSTAVAQLDYEHFGADIVFLAGALSTTPLWNELAQHVSWNDVRTTQLMHDATTPNHGPQVFDFSSEPSFWVWYFGGPDRYNKEQYEDVKYTLTTLFSRGDLSAQHVVPSHAFGKDISWRTMALVWDINPTEEDLFAQPIAQDEAADLAVAYAVVGSDPHTWLRETDITMLVDNINTVDMTQEYTISPHMQQLFHTTAQRLPLAVVCAAMIMANQYDSDNELMEHFVDSAPACMEQHFELFHNLYRERSAFFVTNAESSVHTRFFMRCAQHFDVTEAAKDLIKRDLHACSSQELDRRKVQKLLVVYAQSMVIDAMATEWETEELLQHIFDAFTHTYNGHTRLDESVLWWGAHDQLVGGPNNSAWKKALSWFAPTVREHVRVFMNGIIADEELVTKAQGVQTQSRFKNPFEEEDSTQSKSDAASLRLDTFSARHWNSSKRKLKM